jgi:hypothetical protein
MNLLEHDIQNQIRLALSPYGVFFRSNVGEAWTGPEIIKTEGGGVYIPKAHRFNSGLPPGFSDLFGVVPVQVGGRTLGVFTAIEVKRIGGRVSADQENFLAVMQARGALGGVARSVDDAIAIVSKGVTRDEEGETR